MRSLNVEEIESVDGGLLPLLLLAPVSGPVIAATLGLESVIIGAIYTRAT